MDIKKADPTQRLREATQESQQTAQPKLYPKGFSEVPNSLEQVKQSNAFEQALADGNPASKAEKGSALDGLRIGSDTEDLLSAIADALDNIPSAPGSIPPDVVNALLARLRGISSGPTPTTSVQSEQFEKLKDTKINANEIVREARTNNPIEDFVTEVRVPNVPSSPVRPGDALDGFQIGGSQAEDLLAAVADALDSIPSVPGSIPQGAVNAILDRLRGISSSDSANGSTPTTSVRSEQINRIRAALTQILIGNNQK